MFYVETSRTGRKRRVRVVVYDTVKEMQTAGRRCRPDVKDGFKDALALSQPRFSFRIDAEGKETHSPHAGMVRLVKGEMGAAVVSHEMVHMGLAIYRNDWHRSDWNEGLGDLDTMANEEVLCHIVGDLVRSATSKFWAAGYYD